MGAREPGQWTGKVYRVRIYHLYADGSGSYMRQTYGPYTTKRAARAQATRLLDLATVNSKKAMAEIEESPLEWSVTA